MEMRRIFLYPVELQKMHKKLSSRLKMSKSLKCDPINSNKNYYIILYYYIILCIASSNIINLINLINSIKNNLFYLFY